MNGRSILRLVVRSILSCSFVVAHVAAPCVVDGVTTAVSKSVGLGCQFLLMFGECGRNASDPVLHLGGFLVHECDDLLQVSSMSISLNLFVSWFIRIGVLLGWISSPCASVLFLKCHDLVVGKA